MSAPRRARSPRRSVDAAERGREQALGTVRATPVVHPRRPAIALARCADSSTHAAMLLAAFVVRAGGERRRVRRAPGRGLEKGGKAGNKQGPTSAAAEHNTVTRFDSSRQPWPRCPLPAWRRRVGGGEERGRLPCAPRSRRVPPPPWRRRRAAVCIASPARTSRRRRRQQTAVGCSRRLLSMARRLLLPRSRSLLPRLLPRLTPCSPPACLSLPRSARRRPARPPSAPSPAAPRGCPAARPAGP